MKVYLLKDIEKVGMAGEIISVQEGYGRNFLIPRKLAAEITQANQNYFSKREKHLEKRKEVIETKTSLLAERIKSLKLQIKRKMHDDGKLYGSVNAGEIVDLLEQKGISVSKSQIIFDKAIKSRGTYDIIVKLTNRLQPKCSLTIVPELS